ncbi:unnamed protein product [Cladocopium goreaui]|uniref:Pentatricopeptide repeat-containing protein, chloroplastic n=1 Tax=Cladocopium goreaui TaxID=2562237 RepID=A0A9P1CQE3_9DINO|nr:unnamed protein product [Cladocopium goreaui]
MLVPLSIQKSSAHEEQCIAKPLIENEVGQLRARLHLQSSMLDLARCKGSPHAAPVREFSAKPLQAEDEDLEPFVSTPGRQHFYLRGRIFEEAVASAQAGAMPLVWEHLCRQQAARQDMEAMRPYISEVGACHGHATSDKCYTVGYGGDAFAAWVASAFWAGSLPKEVLNKGWLWRIQLR